MRRAAVLAAVGFTGVTALSTPAAAALAATTPLTCTATATPVNPVQYSHVTISIKSKSAANTLATVDAHYRTKTNTHHAEIDGTGAGHTTYNISGATIGYKVVVVVTVTKGGRTGKCQTYFIPRHK